MKTFIVNGKEYKAKPFDFNFVCDLEDMGISLEMISKKPMSAIRAYFAMCAGKGSEYAGKELEAHVIGGGELDDITTTMSEEMEKSDFFRSLNKTEEAEDAENQEEKNKK